MNAKPEPTASEVKDFLQSYLDLFSRYAKEVFGAHHQPTLDNYRMQLQRLEPQASTYLIQINGDGIIVLGNFGIRQQVTHRDLLTLAVMGGNNELTHNFGDFDDCVTALINKAIGRIDARLWPPARPHPVLTIHDAQLQQRCGDLLQAPNNFDRVVREATWGRMSITYTKLSHAAINP